MLTRCVGELTATFSLGGSCAQLPLSPLSEKCERCLTDQVKVKPLQWVVGSPGHCQDSLLDVCALIFASDSPQTVNSVSGFTLPDANVRTW